MLYSTLSFAFQYLHTALAVIGADTRRGQGLVEYALILALVAVAVIVILTILGPSIGNLFSTTVCGVQSAGGLDPDSTICN